MFDGLPEDWETTTLGAIATLGGGTTPSKGEEGYWKNGTVPWATPTDITSLPTGCDRVSKTEVEVSERALAECSLTVNPPGTVLMTSRATIGYAAINDVPMTTNQGFINFRCGERADPQFLLHWLTAKREFLVAAAGGSTFKELSRGTAKLLPILLPPIDEQRRIAEVLRSVDDAIAAQARAENDLVAVRAELIEELVNGRDGNAAPGQSEATLARADWAFVKLGELLSIKHGFAFSSEFFTAEPKGTILLTPGNFGTEKHLYFGKNTKYYDGPIPEGYLLRNGDLLVVMTDLTQDMAILGNAVRLESQDRVLHNQRIGKVECLDRRRLNIEFARLLLNSVQVQTRIKATASGTTVRHTSPSKLLEIEVALPPLNTQMQIVEIAAALDSACKRGEVADGRTFRSVVQGRLVALKDAIARDLLSGRVRVPA